MRIYCSIDGVITGKIMMLLRIKVIN